MGVTPEASAPADRRVIRSFAPATGELIGEVRAATRDDVRATVARAKKAQLAWAVLPIEERAARVLRLRDAIDERTDEIIDVLVRECGKPRQEALVHEIATLLDLATYYCENAARILATEPLEFHLLKHRRGTVRYVPRGVIGVISPWNFPFVIPMGSVIAGLVAGNAVVVKPSEIVPLVLVKAKEIYDATGLPEDLFGLVNGYGDAGEALVDAGIQKMVFTGSVETGKRVAAACGARLVPCVMELGGKAPLVACADADVERTARAIVYGAFANSGQACISVERVYANERIYDALVARVAALTGELRQGDPARDWVDVGAIIFPRQVEVAERLVRDATAKGARLVAGGKRCAGPGQLFEPTVLVDCNHSMAVMTEEIFGPVVALERVSSDEEAIALANDSHLGLNAYVFTSDRAKGERLAARIDAGSVVVNDVLSNYGAVEAPFGGTKQSGYGRVHGDDELRDMCEKRHVSVERFRVPGGDALWYPYTQKGFGWLRRGVRALFARGGVAKKVARFF